MLPPISPPPIVRVDPPLIAPVIRPPVPVAPDPSPVVYDVKAMAGQETMYSGSMRISRSGRASFAQNFSQSNAPPCAAVHSWEAGEQTSFTLQLVRDQMSTGSETNLYISADWVRPLSPLTCPGGSRSASLRQTLELAPHTSRTIRGDAGLEVTVTRR